ncbi:hypothetical protein QCB45_01850 [Thiomicrorhabdus sp. ZW0627]|uniref:hypothetical protein n=1 Tax=Thiomicrorhabdus sp. ZW0627 TaxID=3039774 RepID=UPI00243704D0|nr:hypothetical protein [Thiomicrorhabdus sp. ZW0627]MDG6773060.1 hypothetical protein [Thiomicrorhabdus sp. ZW0627]
MSLNKKAIWTAMFTASLGLTACGGGSTTASNTVSGTVADGYLAGAKVCLDLNANKLCDAGEPSATTDANGKYSFEATPAQIASAAVIAKVIGGETIDSDIGGVVAKDYVLSAPAGKPEFVSPITTMVQSKLELNPSMTPAQAEASVKSELGVTADTDVDLYENFIEAGKAGDANYKVIHQTAQVVARVLATFSETLTTTLQNQGVQLTDEDAKKIQLIVAKAVSAKLPSIYSAAKIHIEDNGEVDVDFADSKSNETEDATLSSMTGQDYEDSKSELTLLETSESITPVEAMNAGGAVFMNMRMQEMKQTSTTDTTYTETQKTPIVEVMGMLKDAFYQAKVDVQSFLGLKSEDEVATRLAAKAPEDEIKSMPVTQNADGSITFKTPDGHQLQVFSVAKMSLAGKTMDIEKGIEDFDGADASVTFEEGDYVYQFAYSETPDLHLGNIGNLKGFSELCPTVEIPGIDGDYACDLVGSYELGGTMDPATGAYTQYTFSDYINSSEVRKDAINQKYWKEEQLSFYIKDATAETVAMCNYEADANGMPVKSADGSIACKANTEVVLGNVVTGALADTTPYVAVPMGRYEDNKLEVGYQVYTTDGTNPYRLDDSIAADGSVRTGIFKPFNLSAMQRIINTYNATDSTSSSEPVSGSTGSTVGFVQ